MGVVPIQVTRSKWWNMKEGGREKDLKAGDEKTPLQTVFLLKGLILLGSNDMSDTKASESASNSTRLFRSSVFGLASFSEKMCLFLCVIWVCE